jgi:hypothetical protein
LDPQALLTLTLAQAKVSLANYNQSYVVKYTTAPERALQFNPLHVSHLPEEEQWRVVQSVMIPSGEIRLLLSQWSALKTIAIET